MSGKLYFGNRKLLIKVNEVVFFPDHQLKMSTSKSSLINHLVFLWTQLTLKDVELEATREERDTARCDVRDTHLAKDEIIRRAWEVRDQAVGRKNAAEIELARTRIDVLQINSQLLEAIQQKIELSQQLEQWQVRSTWISFSIILINLTCSLLHSYSNIAFYWNPIDIEVTCLHLLLQPSSVFCHLPRFSCCLLPDHEI